MPFDDASCAAAALQAKLSELGEKGDAASLQAVTSVTISWFEMVIGIANPSPPMLSLAAKLFGVACKARTLTKEDKAILRNAAKHVERLAAERGGLYVDLSARLEKLLHEAAAGKR